MWDGPGADELEDNWYRQQGLEPPETCDSDDLDETRVLDETRAGKTRARVHETPFRTRQRDALD